MASCSHLPALPVFVSTAPVVLQPTRTKPRGVPRCPWGCCAARGVAQQAKQAWGQMGTAWGRTPTPRPAGLPRPRHAWQGSCRCSRKQTHRFGNPNLPLWVAVGRCGSCGDTSRSTNFLCTKKLRAKLLRLGISSGISLLLFIVAVALLRPGRHGPGPCAHPPGTSYKVETAAQRLCCGLPRTHSSDIGSFAAGDQRGDLWRSPQARHLHRAMRLPCSVRSA